MLDLAEISFHFLHHRIENAFIRFAAERAFVWVASANVAEEKRAFVENILSAQQITLKTHIIFHLF